MIRLSLAACGLLLSPMAGAASAQPTSVEQAGPYLQAASRTVFPEQVGDFRRSSMTRFDERGDDFSATYNLTGPKGRLVVSVYVYPAPYTPDADAREAACEASFRETTAAITAKPGVRRIEQGPAPEVAGVARALRRHASYESRTLFDGSEQDVRTAADLYCYVAGNWLVKYRTTSHHRFDARPEIEQFIRTGPWPGRALP